MAQLDLAALAARDAATQQLLHDARNHLRNLSGLGLMLAQWSQHPEAALFRRCVHNETQQIEHLLESLCAATQGAEVDEPEAAFGVREHLLVLAHALQPLAQESGAELQMEAPPAPVAVSGKPRLLNRLLANLIRNAIAHARARRIGVSAFVEPCAITGARRLRYVVQDDGIGVAAAMHWNARFSAADAIGHGQGLAICAGLARQIGATLHIGDGAGGGTDAELVLPITGPSAPSAP